MIPYAILLSAGESKRMGLPKALLLYQDGKSFLTTILLKLLKVCTKVVIVTGSGHKLIEQHIEEFLANFKNPDSAGVAKDLPLSKRVTILYNDAYKNGMFTSLQTGVKAIHNDEGGILYHFVDQPAIPPAFYDLLNEWYERYGKECDWIQPVYNRRGGHPVILLTKIIRKIARADSDVNLSSLKKSSDIALKRLACNYPQITIDFDTPEDLREYGLREKTVEGGSDANS